MLNKLTVPLGIVTTIIGGSAWLTTIRNDLNNLEENVSTYSIQVSKQKEKQIEQAVTISKMDGKLDLIIDELHNIRSRIVRKPRDEK